MGSLEPPSPPYPMKMKQFGLSETKLLHFHGIFYKNEKMSKANTHTFIHTNPLSRNPGSHSDETFQRYALISLHVHVFN